jgi:hypothetical protein
MKTLNALWVEAGSLQHQIAELETTVKVLETFQSEQPKHDWEDQTLIFEFPCFFCRRCGRSSNSQDNDECRPTREI